MKTKSPLSGACKKYEEDLVLYYYGECSVAESHRVVQHLSECMACRGFFDDLGGLLPQLAKSQELPQTFWDNYYRETVAKLSEREAQIYGWRSFFAPVKIWLMPAFGTAAVAALALGLLFAKGPLLMDGSSAKLPEEITADANQLEFFRSLDMLESLSQLEERGGGKTESNTDRSNNSRFEQGAA
ncbi:MAG: anti-sigma factor family protein [Candidatus Binatia bacterium]